MNNAKLQLPIAALLLKDHGRHAGETAITTHRRSIYRIVWHNVAPLVGLRTWSPILLLGQDAAA